LACAWSSDAAAFCRTTTSPVPADFQPSSSACWTNGLPLWWRNACVGYSLQKDASRQISYDDASRGITAAFTKWTSTVCPTDGSGDSRVSIDVHDEGAVSCGLVQYNSDQPNQHVIVFRDDQWPHNDANNTLALTTVVFNPDTGEIYDADMEINTAQQTLTIGDPIPSDGYDFASIVTHETGHFLGMAHSGNQHATMFAHYQPGSTTLRNLASDDVSGICSIYPPDGSRSVATSVTPSGRVASEACDPIPRHGFGGDCAAAAKKTCAVARGIGARGHGGDGGNATAEFAWVGAAAMMCVIVGLRRRARTGKTRGST
jgi:hypothetical protein